MWEGAPWKARSLVRGGRVSSGLPGAPLRFSVEIRVAQVTKAFKGGVKLRWRWAGEGDIATGTSQPDRMDYEKIVDPLITTGE